MPQYLFKGYYNPTDKSLIEFFLKYVFIKYGRRNLLFTEL